MTLFVLVKRNMKLFFKDKGLFFSSLITPIILLILFITFLGNVFRDSFVGALPEGFVLEDKIINGCVSGQLLSSLLAVVCVTIAFSSNIMMIQDKYLGTVNDFNVSPVKKSVLATSYLIATLLNTLLMCFVTCFLGFIYLAIVGWYLSFVDVLLIFVDIIIMSLFGTLLSSIIYRFLSTQGQANAFGIIVSSAYGFICGAYMPMSQFGEGLRNALMLLPGTYGTALFRNHLLQGVYDKMSSVNVPSVAIEGMKDAVDCNIYFFSHKVEISTMYIVILVTDIVLFGLYILLSNINKKKKGE